MVHGKERVWYPDALGVCVVVVGSLALPLDSPFTSHKI